MHGGSLSYGSGGPLVCIVDHTDDVIRRPSSVPRDPFFSKYVWTQFFPDYSKTEDMNGRRPGEWKTMGEYAGPVTR